MGCGNLKFMGENCPHTVKLLNKCNRKKISKIIGDENLSLNQFFKTGRPIRQFKPVMRQVLISGCCHLKTLATKEEASAPGYNTCKDKVKVLVCSNASEGQRLLLLLIEKSGKPRAF